MTKEQILNRVKNMKRRTDILNGFNYLGTVDMVYPMLSKFLSNTYTVRIWEWYNKEFRIATIHFNEDSCEFLCEATPINLLKHLAKEQ